MSGPPLPARILVVDDVQANRDLLVRRLTRLGHEVAEADTGGAALERLRTGGCDLVLLDVMLPDLQGPEVLERLKADPALRHIPVIMVSALDELATTVRCIELGALDYLPKPIEPVLLRARVGAALEQKRLRDAEQRWARAMERELEIGREIQTGFLPHTLPQPPGWEVAAAFRSARQVAGDFYDAFPLPGGNLIGLVVGDVCGKGVGAALFMGLYRTLIRAVAEEQAGDGSSSGPLLRTVRAVNDYLTRNHERANMFATLFFAALDPATGAVSYVNGGHEPALIAGPAGVRAALGPTGPVVGAWPDARFATGEARVAPGETLLVCTDGVTEAGTVDAPFGEARLPALIAGDFRSARELLDRIVSELDALGTADDADDVTLLAARHTGTTRPTP